MRHAAGELAARVRGGPDLVLASSMMDLAEFQEKAGLAEVPTLLFMHENQLTYDRANPDLDRGQINWRSVMAADRTAFNSAFHLEDFFAAVGLLEATPARIDEYRNRALVLPVGISADGVSEPGAPDGGPPVIVWNHRWEADKDPAEFVEAIEALTDLPFRLLLLGGGPATNRYRRQLEESHADRIIHSGHAPPDLYRELLRRADIVVSTAHQEFFGISVAEAMAAGAVPLVPNRLAYPELLGPELRPCLYEDGTLAIRLRDLLRDAGRRATLRPLARAAGCRFDWSRIAPRYDDLIDSMI
jgi:glycosyltransferase involved in cell wall biosynthesis